ncbi:MAG: ATP-binding protein [Peptococcaceae bacterium]|nr:ATP-binding protein [Peptococcaceae bacterium]
MSPYFVIVCLMSDIVFIYAITKFMEVFFEKVRTPQPFLMFSLLLYFVFTSVDHVLFLLCDITMPYVIYVIGMLSILFIVTLNYESSMPKRLAAALSNFVVFMIAIMAASLLMSLVLSDVLAMYTAAYMLGSLLSLLLAHILNRFKRIRKNNTSKPLFWVSTLFVPGSTLLTLFFIAANLQLIAGAMVFIFWLGSNFLVLFVYDSLSAAYEEKLKSALYSQEKEYYLSQCQLMQESLEKMKAFRHDVKNHLAALKECSADRKTTADYLNSLLTDIGESEIFSDTGNIAFDSIINYKLRNARQDSINLDLRISVPPILSVEAADVVTILGNLLDNALEAVAKADEKIIILDIEFGKGGLFLKMDNSFNGEIEYLDVQAGVEEKQIASLKEGEGHGYGLKNIRKSLEKYNGYMKITHTESIFSVGVFLYVDDK